MLVSHFLGQCPSTGYTIHYVGKPFPGSVSFMYCMQIVGVDPVGSILAQPEELNNEGMGAMYQVSLTDPDHLI